MASDVWCPTHAQLQAKIDQSKREDDEEEARIRAQAQHLVSQKALKLKQKLRHCVGFGL